VSTLTRILVFVAALLAAWDAGAGPDKRTVCTITVNSMDEQAAMRRHLPERQYTFVELVEHGRIDWLATACRQQIRCDVLVLSGHFNGTDFYTTRLDVNDHLPVAQMERASCSASCPGLFSHLKEVYLFGCNSLNPDPGLSPTAEVERSLIRAGHSAADAGRVSRELGTLHAESNREVMRRIFVTVPAIYGFSSTAPLGPLSASLLDRYFQAGSSADFASGRANRRLLGAFAANSMTVVPGMSASDSRAAYRAEVCRFVDERLSAAKRLRFIHQILTRDTAEARMFFERIEAFLASLIESDRQDPQFMTAIDEIANDRAARERYLALARDAEPPPIRARMIDVGQTLHWLSPEEHRNELVRMMGDLLARNPMSGADVDLICSVNKDRAYDNERGRISRGAPSSERVDRAAALACLGNGDDHTRMLAALTSANDVDMRMAEIYFYHRPISDVNELRAVTAAIATMTRVDAQVRALDTLARLHMADRDALAELVKLFPRAASVAVQRAIAGVLIRADHHSLASADMVSVLRDHRLRSADGNDVIDILIRRLQSSS
jgi:hypothetical protein